MAEIRHFTLLSIVKDLKVLPGLSCSRPLVMKCHLFSSPLLFFIFEVNLGTDALFKHIASGFVDDSFTNRPYRHVFVSATTYEQSLEP